MFEKALKNLNCLPDEALHIGDLLETDIKGANDYKIKSVWLNESQSQNTTGIKPFFEIADILELTKIIESFNK